MDGIDNQFTTLEIDEQVAIESSAATDEPLTRGKILQLSTKKPPVKSTRTVIKQPDPIPRNSTTIMKAKPRIARRGRSLKPKKSCSKPAPIEKTVATRRRIPPIVVPGREPPLQGFWTHKINLPYPPSHQQQQLVGAGTVFPQPALPYMPYMPTVQPYMQPVQPYMQPVQPYMQPYVPMMQPIMQPILPPLMPYGLPQPPPPPPPHPTSDKNRVSRKVWRNYKKNEKYWQRRSEKERKNK